ncbi:hypothetical protein C5167_035727 [Papaver somniferum]|nr:hypothetical protein C5167_035727 [Papaver somniferum]
MLVISPCQVIAILIKMWATVAAQPDLVEIVIDGELLTSSNYRTWKLHMRRNLKRQGLWGFLGKSSVTDCHKDKKALEVIKMSCQPYMKAHILYAENATEAWEWLAESASSPTEDKERHDKMVAEAAKAKENLNGVMKADLTGNNYKNWKFYVENLLASKYLWNVVVGIDNFRTRDYKEKNRHAERIIMESCGKEMHLTFTAHVMPRKLGRSNYIKYSRLLHAVQRYGFREKHIDRNGRYWGSACEYFKEFSEAVVAEITEYGSTALHVAVMLGRVDFVKELLELMTPEQLEIKTRQGNALSVAAGGNNLEIVKMLVKKNPNLLAIQDQHGHIPLVISVINAGEDMVHYLYSVTPKKLYLKHDKCMATLLIAALRDELYGESGFIRHGLNDCGGTLLSVLSGRPSAFQSGNQFGYLHRYQSLLYRLAGTQRHGPVLTALKTIVPGVKKPLDDKVKHYRVLQIVNTVSLLLTDLSPRELHKIGAYETIQKATTHGIVELFDRLAASNPSLLQSRDELGRSLIQNTIIFRQQRIFQYISQMGQMYQSITSLDLSDNNVLHCAGFWVPSTKLDRVPGAALQMQRELQWFQEVERVVHPRYREMNNKDGLKPRDLFEQEHKKLKEKGATWMKDTSQACMLVNTT